MTDELAVGLRIFTLVAAAAVWSVSEMAALMHDSISHLSYHVGDLRDPREMRINIEFRREHIYEKPS